ncbi:hypothetical protein [Weissella soli]|uniref:hypothetical protein n=1 Tax=Weissella soli TaxID=155866 RepID=UPI0011BB3623|nr:hypothetical protein [Weissella soli]QEA34766.1 hypothetical protein FGL88_02930 [Weissella soli]
MLHNKNIDESNNDLQLRNILKSINKIRNLHSAVGIAIYRLEEGSYLKISQMFNEDAFEGLIEILSFDNEDYKQLNEKFPDSVILSLAQRDFINKRSTTAENASRRALDNLDEIKTTKTGIYSDLIAILGIFTAITFATFGATSMLSSIFSHINNITIPKMGLIFIIAGIYLICLYALIAVMFVGIHKIIHSEDVNEDNGKYEYKFTNKLVCYIIAFCIGLIGLGVGIVWFG